MGLRIDHSRDTTETAIADYKKSIGSLDNSKELIDLNKEISHLAWKMEYDWKLKKQMGDRLALLQQEKMRLTNEYNTIKDEKRQIQTIANINAFNGAIEDCAYWISEIGKI